MKGYIVSLLTGGFPADRFGRKFNMYLLTFFMVIACIVETVARDWTVWLVAKLRELFYMRGSDSSQRPVCGPLPDDPVDIRL